MRKGVETRLDGSTLIVRIPMRFQRRGGRKRIVAPDGSAIVPSSKPQPNGTLVKALARAWRWQKLLAAPELVARTWAEAKREGDEITELEVTVLLADFATIWNELFPAEQARIVQLLVERVDVQEDALEVRVRAEGLVSLVAELRQPDERRAA